MIYLSSCETATRSPADTFRGLAPALVAAGVPAVLAMQDLIAVETARHFSRTFYEQLFEYGQVDLASNVARASLIEAELNGSSIPVLFSRLPDNRLLASPDTTQESNLSYPAPPEPAPPPSLDQFVGRQTELGYYWAKKIPYWQQIYT